MPTTDTAIRKAKPSDKAYNIYDGEGLFVSIRPTGKKVWVCRFYIKNKSGLYTIGRYPDISLSKARAKKDEIKALAKQGINPNLEKKKKQRQTEVQRLMTVKHFGEVWYNEKIKDKKSASYQYNIRRSLDKDIYPAIGQYPISEVTTAHIYELLKKIEKRGAPVWAINVKQHISAIYKFAASTGNANLTNDPTILLTSAVERPKINHAKALTEQEIQELLERLSSYGGQRHIKIAIELLLLMFCRTVEIRRGEWHEINFENREWHIPAGKMKKGNAHIVPLSNQAIALLQELKSITGSTGLLVPSMMRPRFSISATTINKAFIAMGYKTGVITGHDFRATANTHLAGMGFNDRAIERQLAHIERNSTTRAYNHQEYLKERHQMMQAWADWIDSIRPETPPI